MPNSSSDQFAVRPIFSGVALCEKLYSVFGKKKVAPALEAVSTAGVGATREIEVSL